MSKEKKTEGKHTINVVCDKDKHKVPCVKDTIKMSDSVSIMKFDAEKLNKLTSGSCLISSTIPVANQPSEKIAVCKEGNTIKIFKIIEEK